MSLRAKIEKFIADGSTETTKLENIPTDSPNDFPAKKKNGRNEIEPINAFVISKALKSAPTNSKPKKLKYDCTAKFEFHRSPTPIKLK